MRKIREVLRLKWEHGLTNRTIARSCSLSHSTVAEYLRRAEEAGVSWPLSPDWDDAELERRMFPPAPLVAEGTRPLPDWRRMDQELKSKGMTMFLLWE